ncbi:hypothetical protein [Porphyromonas macacae]|uniref:Uncharacterized protein n=1 Tax=Porphyromonas macacae TaxID=28115 RepID=A0A379DI73_9PORP|nr:hypothetical protein [Porphyromonas macacae]SUB78031.1 Uncharacterised protein [Porphyromonas macacae]
MKTNKKEIDELLDMFYEGSTSREQEMKLYLLLLNESDDGVYEADKKLIVSLMEGNFDETSIVGNMEEHVEFITRLKRKEAGLGKISSQRNYIGFFNRKNFRYMAAASLFILIAIGFSKFGLSDENIFMHDVSMIDGREISQAEADKLTDDVFNIIDIKMKRSRESLEEIDKTVEKIKTSISL